MKLEQDYWRSLVQFDALSFQDLMNRYGQDVWNFAFLLTKSADLADDITQDVFLKAYKGIGSFRGDCSIKTWLLRLTHNTSVNVQRSAFMRRVLLVDWVVNRKETSPSAEREVMEKTLSDDIWRVVMELPEPFREVLVLDAKYELSVKEIAELLQVSEGTVKSRLSRARKKVSAMWKEVQAYE